MSLFKFVITYLLVLSKMIWCLPRTDIEKKMEGDIRADDVLNVCLESVTHKKEPGAEQNLMDECSPWRENACCTPDTVEKAHTLSLYSIQYDMCPQKNLSEKCKTHFIRDTCFYECSPNIGPWKEMVEGASSRTQRFRDVPLCYSECQDWFNACAEDYTCADNWAKKSDYPGNETNKTHICEKDPAESCRPIKDVFGTPKKFCETIWDNSWKVVNDSEPCMKLSFDTKNGNPNGIVAERFAYERFRSSPKQPGSSNISKPNNAYLILIIIFLYYQPIIYN